MTAPQELRTPHLLLRSIERGDIPAIVRLAGALLGSHADRLPAGARRRLSLEGRSSFEPLDLDTDAGDRWQSPTRSTSQ